MEKQQIKCCKCNFNPIKNKSDKICQDCIEWAKDVANSEMDHFMKNYNSIFGFSLKIGKC